MHITERQIDILNFLIEEYIEKAEPISSGLIEEMSDFNVSAATIRNDMQELTKKKYITQLHTSGGRIPTDRAYRLYVDNLFNLDDFEIKPNWQKRVDIMLASLNKNPRDINKTIAQLLSDLSENVVIAGVAEEEDFYKTGLASLFELPEFQEINKVFRLTSFFDEFDRIFDQMEREFFSGFYGNDGIEDINIFIGRENRHPAIREETVMTAKYNLPHNLVGSLTIIGPTRMDYKKNIGLVRYTTEKLNQLIRKI